MRKTKLLCLAIVLFSLCPAAFGDTVASVKKETPKTAPAKPYDAPAATQPTIPAKTGEEAKASPSAQTTSTPPAALSASAGTVERPGSDIVLLMDSSGSMRKTDPNSYRKDAARLFISLLGKDDRIGIISFGDDAKVLSPLVKNSTENRNKLFGAINKISSKESSTNIQEGVRKGFAELRHSQRKNKSLILMSDGRLTLGSKEKEEKAMSELGKLLPELSRSSTKLYSIAFTEQSDVKLLDEMARETGGFFKLARTDKDVHVIFASMFEKIKSPDTVPLEGNAFTIDKDINEAIVLISKKQGTSTVLVDPFGKKNTPAKFAGNMQWYESKVFDMITIRKPATGKWNVNLSTKEGNKVFVITDLSLKTSFDKNFVYKGDKLKTMVWLEKEGALLAEGSVLEQVAFLAEVTGPDGTTTRLGFHDDGQTGDDKPGDGIYTQEINITAAGDYVMKIAAEGKTFKREKAFQFKATAPPAPQAVLQKPEQKGSKSFLMNGRGWGSVLIQFGVINLALLLVVLLVYAGKRAKTAKTAKKPKGKKGRK
ncbi:MAG: vWA domain-containing protein [Nitrospirota bacterium]